MPKEAATLLAGALNKALELAREAAPGGGAGATALPPRPVAEAAVVTPLPLLGEGDASSVTRDEIAAYVEQVVKLAAELENIRKRLAAVEDVIRRAAARSATVKVDS